MLSNTTKFFYQYFCFDFYQCKGITWLLVKIKVSKKDDIREKSITESIICLSSKRIVHCCSSLMSNSVLALEFDCILNEIVVLSLVTNRIFIVRHKGNGFYFWFCKKNLRALGTQNFSRYRASLLGQHEPRKGRGRHFTAHVKADYHLRLMCMAISGFSDLCLHWVPPCSFLKWSLSLVKTQYWK